MDKRSRLDFLSNLPLSIIHTILERIPIIEAVQTSILSREWRYKWSTLPHLNFIHASLKYPDSEILDFIQQALLLHQGPILKFELDYSDETISQHINPWLTFLSRNGVRMIDLYQLDEYRVILPSLYSCQNLTHLKLFNCDIPPPPPSFKGFLCLRCLDLEFVCLSDNAIILADLPLLEELSLELDGVYDLKINSPNLKTLYLRGVFKNICLHAPLLRKMNVDCTRRVAPIENSVCTYTEFLGGLTALEELMGTFYFFEFLSIGIESCDSPLVFPHLRLIQLCSGMFFNKKVESVIAHLYKAAINLDKIKVSYYCFAGSESYTSLQSYIECPFSFTFERLKVIELLCPYGNWTTKPWMKVVKCLLARSPALETMMCVQQSMSDSRLLEQASTVLTFPRASPNAKILFNGQDKC